jgi:SAM-dependent methyltransferase
MSIDTRLRGLATSIHDRLRARRPTPSAESRPVTPSEVPPQCAPAPEADPFGDAVRAYLYETGFCTRHERANHVRRLVNSLRWIPDRPGRVLDPAPGDTFPGLMRRFRGCEVETPPFFNLEKETAPYPEATFDGVLLMEVLEHFTVDPMYAMLELNRVLKPGGFLFVTTPNIASWLSLHRIIHYESPYIFGTYHKAPSPDRHNREYSVNEVWRLAENAGFAIEKLEAINSYPSSDAFEGIPGVNPWNRGDTTYLLARKAGPARERYPDWLYPSWEQYAGPVPS